MSWQNRKRKLINLDIKKEIISKLFMYIRLFMLFIRESLFLVLTKERLFMLFKFTCTVYIKVK